MNKADIEKIISALESVAKRPYMYMGSEGEIAAQPFLAGFHCALRILNLDEDTQKFRNDVLTERGWELSSVAPYTEMKQRSMSPDQMINEILTIEIEVWKKILSQKQDPDETS
jgi:hypothetical protein